MTTLRWLAFAALAVPATLAAAPAYIATPLGSLGGVSIYGTGIDSSGRVAGWGDTDAAGAVHRHAFLFSGGTLANLGTLGGGVQSFGEGINDLGDVAGFSNTAGSASFHAVVFRGGTLVDLNPVLQAQSATAYAINAKGDVIGGFRTAAMNSTHAYRYRPATGAVVDLDTFGGTTSQAYAVNVFGAVTGFAHISSGDQHAFRFDEGGLVDLGTLGGPASTGYAIAADGAVVGSSFLAGGAGPHAFIHDGRAMNDLGTLGGATSTAFAINAAGRIVGESTNAQGASRAFVSVTGGMIDLNTVTTGLNGVSLTTATAINDAGQIVSMSCTAPLVCPQAFRLDPVPAAKVEAIEYYNAALGHYFITAIADEITKLDNGTIAGWARTGGQFGVYAAEQVGTKPVCRFFSTSFAPKSSHFYSPDAGECATLKRNADWQLEGLVFNVGVPDAGGNCAPGTEPVYRLYNNGIGGAPNHRYTTSLNTRSDMLAAGWIPEGYGPLAVVMCAPT